MNKKMNIVVGITLVVYLLGFGMFHLVTEDRHFSPLENRVLQQLPEFRWDNFFSGKYATKVEEYVADQFPLRDKFIALKSQTQLLMQRKDNNGVYIGKNDYFLQEFDQPDITLLEKNMGYINEFAKKHNTFFMLAPTATKVYEEYLPEFAKPYDEKQYIDQVEELISEDVNFVPLLDSLLAKKGQYIYYKTDHHWTTLGAYYGYLQFCEVYGIEPMNLDEFEIVEGSDEFYGSLFSKGNFTFAEPDSLQLFIPRKDNAVQVNYVGSDLTKDTMYELSHLEKKDKYSVFLDNNHPLIQVNTSIKNGRKLMIVKDSYANCFIPFLAQHFEEIHILDLRFLNMKATQYAEMEGIEDVLFLYNVQNFAKETGLSKL